MKEIYREKILRYSEVPSLRIPQAKKMPPQFAEAFIDLKAIIQACDYRITVTVPAIVFTVPLK